MQWVLESLPLANSEIGDWLRGLYGEVIELDGLEWIVGTISSFYIKNHGAASIVIAIVNLERLYEPTDLLSTKNVVELESSLDDRRN